MPTSEPPHSSFSSLDKRRRWAFRSGTVGILLIAAYGGVVILEKAGTVGAHPEIEGLLMVGASLCCFASAFCFYHQASFRCPRCQKPFFKTFASGSNLYAMARSCQNCGFTRTSENEAP